MKDVKLIKDPHFSHHPDQLSKGYPGSAAHDLYLPSNFEHKILGANQTVNVNLGFHIHINDVNLAAMILPRSGAGSRGLVVGNLVGLIDQDYQGPIIVSLWNRTDEAIRIDADKAVAQLVFVPVEQVRLVEVTDFDSVTDRGEGGFGSSDSSIDTTNRSDQYIRPFANGMSINLYGPAESGKSTVARLLIKELAKSGIHYELKDDAHYSTTIERPQTIACSESLIAGYDYYIPVHEAQSYLTAAVNLASHCVVLANTLSGGVYSTESNDQSDSHPSKNKQATFSYRSDITDAYVAASKMSGKQ